MRRATFRAHILPTLFRISIHALHEESDHALRQVVQIIVISIHALHEESDS